MNEITVVPPLTPGEIRNQVNLIQQIMKDVMQEGQHFGKIPGCGDKPTLLKPGAEKLSLTFRLRPIIDNDRDIRITDLGDGHREIQVYCHVMSSSGQELATGVGSCSTKESKFRYRGGEKKSTGQPVPKEYWNLKKEGRLSDANETIGGRGFGVMKDNGEWVICEHGEKMENPDIADTFNTVLKMAKKRAYVDGILSATAASDIFTQDIEDMPTDIVRQAPAAEANPTGKPDVQPPVAKSEQAAKPATNGHVISEKQGKRLIAIALGKGYSAEIVNEYVKINYGFDRLSAITTDKYDEIVNHYAEMTGDE